MATSNKDAPSLTLGFGIWTTIRLFEKEPKAIAVDTVSAMIAE
jgi:hypothetical protein